MGFYLRKSVRVGPFRVNFSNSGIGVSAGIPGFRVGAGPKGRYIHVGTHGLYYRQALSPASGTSSGSALPGPELQPHAQVVTQRGVGPSLEIDSADVGKLVDSSSQALLSELNSRKRRLRLLPLAVAVGFTTILAALFSGVSTSLQIAFALLAAGTVVATAMWDEVRKTALLAYSFDADMEAAYEALHRSATNLAGSGCVWHIASSAQVSDRKYHAGASNLVKRSRTFVQRQQPPFVKSNVSTVAIGVGAQVLHFFPDRVLVYAPNGVGAVSYQDLELEVSSSRFIESDHVPSDARVVGSTWQYVNKSGGPDRRFKNNRQLPICLYDELVLRSSTGLNELLQVSRADVAGEFARAVGRFASRIPPELSRSST